MNNIAALPRSEVLKTLIFPKAAEIKGLHMKFWSTRAHTATKRVT